jgi:hypothetical protein
MTKESVSEVLNDPPRVADEKARGSRLGGNRWRIAWVLVLASLLWLLWPCSTPHTIQTLSPGLAPFAPADQVPDLGFPESVLRTWAQYAPYIPAAEYIPPPPGCAISQVSAHPYIPGGV